MKPREIALKALKKVYFEKLFPNVVLKHYSASPQDMALATSIVYTTLQHDLYLEYQYQKFIEHPPHRTLSVILKMSIAQLFFMDKLPDYAIVHEAVELAKSERGVQAGKFVNAVLKQVTQQGLLSVDMESMEGASIATSIPLWLFKMLSKQSSFEQARAYGLFTLGISPLYYRKNPRIKLEKNQSDYPKLEMNDQARAALANGDIAIQDKGSQKVVEILNPQPHTRVLDCCAAPGTKTLYISDLMKNTGTLVAIDLVESRNKLVLEAVERWGSTNVKVITADARSFTDNELFDQVLVDAPCSGLGVIRHKPDIKRNIQPTDLDELQQMQKEILNHMATQVRIGGELVYSTCTINRKENQIQIEQFLKNHEQYTLIEEVQTHPIEENCDGFYIAKLRRTW